MELQSDRRKYRFGGASDENCFRLEWADKVKSRYPRILIVDDEGILRQLYKTYLQDGFEVDTAATGLDAVEKLKNVNFDLVLSDISMPEMDGFTLREYLEKDAGTELMPFVFLTAHEDDELLSRAATLGIDDYLLKPVTKEHLLHTVNRVLGRSRQIVSRLSERIDKRLSEALIPKPPNEVPGWRLALATRNAGAGGGDFLFHRSSGSRTLLIMADIMGHDNTAKFFSYSYGGYIRGLMHASGMDDQPNPILERLSEVAFNDELLAQTALTCAAAVLSPGEISVAGAGHPAPLRITPAGIQIIPVGGVLPGLIPDPGYESETLRVEMGERIALYTDGLFESAEGEEGRNELQSKITAALHNTLEMPLERALRQVMSLFDDLAGNPPKDDTMLLLLEPVTRDL